jgi:ATP-dependent protease Clp ATPase subunit
MRPLLARAVNLSQRYFLEKTFKDKRPSDRQLQVAITHKATALLGISYLMIGQAAAAKSVTQKLLSHMALPRSRPLVMVFAGMEKSPLFITSFHKLTSLPIGPSGHGKTELAKRMGELLSMEMECIDCTEMRYETDLFGPKKPYIGHELGAPLNNFLARLAGRRGIVFLDEFEKTTKEVQNALLIPFDEGKFSLQFSSHPMLTHSETGKYTDRRHRTLIDSSKIIWIIATNALDNIILDFCDINQVQVQTEDSMRHAELMTDLSNRLKQQLKSAFGVGATLTLSLSPKPSKQEKNTS